MSAKTLAEKLGLRERLRFNWTQHAFMVPRDNLGQEHEVFLYHSPALYGYTDTRLGGSFALNMPPGFTEFADIPYRSPAFTSYGRDSSGGKGLYWSEVLEANSQLVHMQFGFAAPSGLVSFFGSYYNTNMSYLAHTGRTPPIMYYAGRGLTFIATLHPGVVLLMLGAHTIRFLAMEPTTKYYTLRPAMGTFWMRANTIANIIGLNKDIIEPVFEFVPKTEYTAQGLREQNQSEITNHYRTRLNEIAPDLFDPDGSLNLMSLASRTQRMANRHLDKVRDIVNKAGEGDADSAYGRAIQNIRLYLEGRDTGLKPESADQGYYSPTRADEGNMAYHEQWAEDLLINFSGATPEQLLDDNLRASFVGDAEAMDQQQREVDEELFTTYQRNNGTVAPRAQRTKPGFLNAVAGRLDKWNRTFEAVQKDGAMWLTLRVDHTESGTTTFTNEVGEASITAKINGESQQNREMRFTTMNGQTGVEVIDFVTRQASAFIKGTVDQLGLSGLMVAGGEAMADIQKTWKGASVDLPSATFTIKCRPWSGDPFTVLMQQDLIVALMLAAALPMSTGPASYTSSMYCSLFARGKHKISEGMITSMSITRGTSNVKNTDDWHDLGVDITFTVTDMSSIVHAPISDSFQITRPISSLSNALNNEGAFLDMLASYSGMSLEDVYYNGRRISYALSRLAANFKDRWSTDYQLVTGYGNSTMARFLTGAFARNSARTIDN